MTSPLLIRTANENDRASIRQIAENTWPDAYGNIISSAQIKYMLDMIYNDEALLEQMQEGHQFYIAEYNHETIGFASVSVEGNEGCKLNKLYILPNIQKTGAGKALLQAAIDYTKAQQSSYLFLQVNKYNKAKDFYTKMGFTIEREIVT